MVEWKKVTKQTKLIYSLRKKPPLTVWGLKLSIKDFFSKFNLQNKFYFLLGLKECVRKFALAINFWIMLERQKKFKAIKSLAMELKICVCTQAFTLRLSRKSCRHLDYA